MARKKIYKPAALEHVPVPPADTPVRNLPPEAYLPNGATHAYARLKNPGVPNKYYRQGPGGPWVTVGYDIWSIEDWRARFGSEYPDGRHWEFFGEVIEIWPEGHSNE